MTWILLVATLAVLFSIGLACVRAHLEAEAALCDCVGALGAVGVTTQAHPCRPVVNEGTQAAPPDGAVGPSPPPPPRAARHLRVIRA